MTKDFDYYLRLPYARRCRLFVDEGTKYWHAWIAELPGCEVDADDKATAFADLNEVFEDYISTKLEWGSAITEPVRWPRFLADQSQTKQVREAELKIVNLSPALDGFVAEVEEVQTGQTLEPAVT